jgi:pyruvate dehydrogenase E2 component (dihydrolipoamide acetyltransferase)
MATDVVMPQMGESIAEGTIVRWIKKVGDNVDRDEPLFEISTDKVDAEIPSPAAGVLSEIRVKEGETVAVNSIVAVIGGTATQAAASGTQQSAATVSEPPAPAKAVEPPRPQPQGDGASSAAPAQSAPPTPPRAAPAPPTGVSVSSSTEDALRQRSSPLVRKIAKEHNVDISHLTGTGIAGRVTKNDILAFVEGKEGRERQELPEGQERRGGQERQEGPGRQVAQTGPGAPAAAGAKSTRPAGPTIERPTFKPGANTEIVPMSVMRKRIAEHMVVSRRTSAHVHSVFEVNFSRVAHIREMKKAEYQRAGASLTYMSFIVKAAIDALRHVPVVNASVDGDSVVFHKDVHVGIAVALDWGLIVPVIKNADEKNLLGLSRSVADLASRARSKQLKPEEVQGGTFTITNPGVFGALFGMPIINQPQVAILGVGNVEKRPVVIDDAIAIRPMAYLTLGYDHRLIDGAVADQFMSHVKHSLENWDLAQP